MSRTWRAGLAGLIRLCIGWIVIAALPGARAAAAPWPGEAWTAATVYTGLDPDFTHDMSGGSWNPVTRTFWVVCNNPGIIWALKVQPDETLTIDTNSTGTAARFAVGGDLEGICQVDFNQNSVYVIAEPNLIRRYDISAQNTATLAREWNVAAHIPAYTGGLGAEGITFIPDAALQAAGFVDPAGNPRVSQNGMGGLMLLAHQNGGRVYAFDLNPGNSSFTFVGAYLTSQTESADLGFDRERGLLYIWHNTGANYLELTDLTSVQAGSERRFNTVIEYVGPKSTGNLEGIAPVFGWPGHPWMLMLDDANQDGAAVMLFRQVMSIASDQEIDVVPGSLTFGGRALEDGPSMAQGITITNKGSQDLHVSSVAINGSEAFTVAADSGETTLAPGAARMVQVTFDPATAGTTSASLTIASDDEDEASMHVALTGTGLIPVLAASEPELVFGPVDVILGDAPTTRGLVLENTGDASLRIGALTLGGAQAGEFTIVNAPGLPLVIAPDASYALVLRFDPQVNEQTFDMQAVLTITSNAIDSPLVIGLSGDAVPVSVSRFAVD